MTFAGWVCVDEDGSTWGAISGTPEAALASGLRAVEEVFGPEEDRSEEEQEAVDEFPRTAQAVHVTVACPTPSAARAALRWPKPRARCCDVSWTASRNVASLASARASSSSTSTSKPTEPPSKPDIATSSRRAITASIITSCSQVVMSR